MDIVNYVYTLQFPFTVEAHYNKHDNMYQSPFYLKIKIQVYILSIK